jgi:hypothetical protein
MNIAFPLRLDHRGRTAISDDDRHIRDLIEQTLFTSPGERVNHPDFGSGLRQLVFAPASPELAAAAQMVIQGALQQWLGELIEVQSVEVESGDGRVTVTVRYRVRRTQALHVAEVSSAL